MKVHKYHTETESVRILEILLLGFHFYLELLNLLRVPWPFISIELITFAVLKVYENQKFDKDCSKSKQLGKPPALLFDFPTP